jgi:hypothetical protein
MTTTKARKSEAAIAYANEVGYAVGLLESILMDIQKCHRVDAERCNWSHVDDMKRLNAELREIENRLHGKGEYAAR